MKNSNLFINLSCIIPALLILCIVNLKAQNELIGYTYLGTFGNHHYYLSNCGTTWEQANEAATEMGGYLATKSDDIYSENRILAEYANPNTGGDGAWIGLRGEQGIYEWANGEPISIYFWSYNFQEPVYADGAVLIGVDLYSDYYGGGSNADSDYSWKSYPISGEFKYMVEFTVQPNCSNNPDKAYVCHNGNTICVNSSAVQSHLDHGDHEGPCGPCNTYGMQTIPDETVETDGHSIQPANVALSESEEELDVVQLILPRNQIHIFPNPASEEIHVVLKGVNHEGTLRILSLTGQEMHALPLHGQKSIILDLSDYATGFYLIDVRCANDHYQKKFVKL